MNNIRPLSYDDLEIGQTWESTGRTITEVDIVTFAGFSGDFNPIHMDHEFARSTPFRRPIAHGVGVLSIGSGLGVQSQHVKTIALVAIRDWTFHLPVFVGDTIRVRTTVASKSLRGRGKRGEVVWQRSIINQHGKIVQEGQFVTLVECKQADPIPDIPSTSRIAESGAA